MIEAAKCMFHKLLGEARDDRELVTPRSRENLCSRPETLVNKLRSRFEMPSEKYVWQTSREHRFRNLQVSHWNRLTRAVFASSSSCQCLSTNPGEWNYEFQMSSFTTTILNLLFTEAEQKGKTRNFRMYIGLGSDGSSADKLSVDLKFNLWDTAITFRPESLHAVRSIRNLVHMSMPCVIVVHPYPLA